MENTGTTCNGRYVENWDTSPRKCHTLMLCKIFTCYMLGTYKIRKGIPVKRKVGLNYELKMFLFHSQLPTSKNKPFAI